MGGVSLGPREGWAQKGSQRGMGGPHQGRRPGTNGPCPRGNLCEGVYREVEPSVAGGGVGEGRGKASGRGAGALAWEVDHDRSPEGSPGPGRGARRGAWSGDEAKTSGWQGRPAEGPGGWMGGCSACPVWRRTRWGRANEREGEGRGGDGWGRGPSRSVSGLGNARPRVGRAGGPQGSGPGDSKVRSRRADRYTAHSRLRTLEQRAPVNNRWGWGTSGKRSTAKKRGGNWNTP
jgi:hypothetical protein